MKQRSKKRLLIAGGAIVVLVAVVVLLWFVAPPVSTQSPVEPAAALTAPAARRPLGLVPPLLPAIAASGQDRIEVCGLGTFSLSQDAARLEALQHDAVGALDRAAARLVDAASERDRALGLYLRSALARISALPEGTGQSTASPTPWDAALARMATTTRDPRVYALALRSCGEGLDPASGEGHCAQLSYRRWAQIDPGNAMPWLKIASQTRQQAELEEALFQMSESERIDNYYGAALELIDHPALASASALDRAVFGPLLVGLDASTALPNYSALVGACSEQAIRAASRRAVCDRIARLMTQQARTMLDQAIGAAIGGKLGWSSARLDALREERDAAAAVSFAALGPPEELLSCKSIEATQRWLADVTVHGELGATRKSIAASHRSTAAWAADWRAQQAEQGSAAQSR